MRRNPISTLIGIFVRDSLPAMPIETTPQNILIVRLDEIGDLILTSPFLRELRRNVPHSQITLVVKREVYNLVERCPYVDEILPFPALRSLRRPSAYFKAWLFGLKMRRSRAYDLAIVPRWDVDSNAASFIAYFSGAGRRLAYSERVTPEKRVANRNYDRLFTDVVFDQTVKHEVERNLDLLRQLGFGVQSSALELWNGNEDIAYAENTLSAHSVKPHETLIVLGIGAGHPHKRWPLSNFAELGRRLAGHGYRFVIVGNKEESHSAQTLQEQIGGSVINIAGSATLRQASAVVGRCHLFIGNDSSPMHMAAAMHLPLVEICCHPESGSLSHPRSPFRFHPWNADYRIVRPRTPRAPCSEGCDADSEHCICDVTVDMVDDAAAEQLAKGAHEQASPG
jgi:heptosyltransferase-2